MVPDVYVGSVKIVANGRGCRFYFRVSPNHRMYWTQFQVKYPEFIFLACKKYGALTELNGFSCFCPEFPSKEDLLDWLARVVSATQRERRFLRLCMERGPRLYQES